jgi:hypothetical protein
METQSSPEVSNCGLVQLYGSDEDAVVEVML